jgi:hypothetical protein
MATQRKCGKSDNVRYITQLRSQRRENNNMAPYISSNIGNVRYIMGLRVARRQAPVAGTVSMRYISHCRYYCIDWDSERFTYHSVTAPFQDLSVDVFLCRSH